MRLVWYSWLVGFGLTLAFELPWALWLLRRVEPSFARRFRIALIANLLTHPLVWFFFPLMPAGYPIRVTVSELWAFGAEAWFYAAFVSGLGAPRALRMSLVANATSFGLGWIVVNQWGRWLFWG
jgi:hypothetical protein